MDKPQSPNVGAEKPVERADRLYTQQEFEAALENPAPSASMAHADTEDTHTGQTLARKNAIEQDATRDIEDAQAFGLDDSSTEFIDLGALEAAVVAGRMPGSAVTIPKASSPAVAIPALDPVADMVHDLEQRLRNYVEANLMERTLEAERRYQEKMSLLQRQAQSALRKRDAELKQHYANHYRNKDQVLRENYQKLMALATKINQQKAQLQLTRKQMEEKLAAANAVYKQVEDMRRLLDENLNSPESIGSSTASRLSVR